MSDYLCEELIVEIFTRVPPKSLLRFRESENRLSLWNPSIRREVSVPELPRKPNPDTQKLMYGFGFDPISDNYKIVLISYNEDRAFLFALKRGTWCEITFPKPEINTRMWLAFLFDGVLHWEVFRHDTGEILTFDLSTHVFGMIPLPAHRDWITTNITTIQGSLALISYRRKVDDTWIRVWKDDSWLVVFKLGTGQLPIDRALQLQPQPNNNCDLLLRTYGEGIQPSSLVTRASINFLLLSLDKGNSKMSDYLCEELIVEIFTRLPPKSLLRFRRKVSVPKYPQSSELVSKNIEFGFGFDPLSDDYKIVGVSYPDDRSFVFALKMGTWCEISSPKSHISSIPEPFLFDGVLHWYVFENISSQEILTFDLSTHVFGMIPLPEPICDWFITNITTIEGSLALISYHRESDDTWIWVWKDDSWSVVFKLGTGQLLIDGALQLQPQPNNNGDLLLSTYDKGLRIYNSKTRERSRVSKKFKEWRSYVETLHLLDMNEDYLLNNSTMRKS
ncbi:hypothetical protein LXL04_037664 [Taraxacum kok-saghyz]